MMRPKGTRRLFRQPDRSAADIRADVDDEIRFHLEERTADLIRDGVPEPDARKQAMAEFGRLDTASSTIATFDNRTERQRRLGQFVAEFWQDVSLGVRLLLHSPGFTVVAALMLALGIGANTAIYSVLDAVFLRPLPYPEPERVVMVSETQPNGSPNSVSGGAYLDWRENQRTFDALALTGRVSYNLRDAGGTERLTGMEVTHEFFDVIRTPLLLGRGFLPDEDRPGGPTNVVVLTEELWRSRFASDPAIVGKSLVLDNLAFTVVGVLPRGAWALKDDSFFVPAILRPDTDRTARSGHWAGVFGRLGPNVTVAQADADLKAIKSRLNGQYPAFKRTWGVQVQGVTEIVGSVTRAPMAILLGAVSFVLLIACTNVANLLLARGCNREHELAVRAAIGASNGRLMRQILTENLLLATVGGLAGIAVATAGLLLLSRAAADALPINMTPRIDPAVLLATLALTVATGIIVGILPALRARRTNLSGIMNSGSKGLSSGGRQRMQSLLIVAEVALTVVLLASAGLLIRSLARTAATNPGFEPSRVLAFDVSLPDVTYKTREQRFAFAQQLLTRLRGLSGVEAAGTGMAMPFSGGGYGEYFGRPNKSDVNAVVGRMNFVSPGYLEALGTRLVAGRRFVDADNRFDAPRIAVLSEHTAKTFFGNEDPLGQQINIAAQNWTVVGIVADVVDTRLDAPRGAFGYVPSAFNPNQMSVALRTPLDPASLVSAVRAEIALLDPGVAIANPRALDRAMDGSMSQRRIVLGLILTFASGALVLAATGLYGVMAYAVATRRREFGVRMAFGATPRSLLRHVLRDGLKVTAVGIVIGSIGAVSAARVLSSQLYQVAPSDPLVLFGTALTVTVVAACASLVPAWRASRFELTASLRD